MRHHIPTFLTALTLAMPAAAQPASAPEPATDLQITPSITCRVGDRTEWIRLSRARGDAIDGVFAFCRDPSLSSEDWIARLESTRDKLLAARSDEAGRDAIREAFAAHIARERAAN